MHWDHCLVVGNGRVWARWNPRANALARGRSTVCQMNLCFELAERKFSKRKEYSSFRGASRRYSHFPATDHRGADWCVANWLVPDPGLILWLANRHLTVDIELNLQGCVGAAEANEELPGWPEIGRAPRLNSSHRCISYAVFC